ncbi:long-chain-fatty-acid--CoA ligase [Phyllobacterium sp. YR531]|uniref:long-chain-fatty-acid--CoA ligase n=1 Tax=Phyllobacterium sp. YR531 TaxID=1144343 RepID=UPI0032990359
MKAEKPAASKPATAAKTSPAAKAAPSEKVAAKAPAAKKLPNNKAAPAAAVKPSASPKATVKPAAKTASVTSTKPVAKPVKAQAPAPTPAVSTKPKTAAKAAPASKVSAKAPAPEKAAASTPVPDKSAAKPKAQAKSSAKTNAAANKTTGKPIMPTPKMWVKHYPDNVPADIPDLPNESLGAFFDEAFKKFSAKPAFDCMGKSINYGELDKYSRSIAAWLQSRGLVKGDRVAIMMPNVLQYPVVIAGVLRAGLIVVNVNPLYTPRELEYQLKDSGAKAIFVLENFAATLQKVVTKTSVQHVVVTAMGDMMGLKGHLVNLVVRRVKKMVPAWSLPGHIPFKTALAKGASMSFKSVDVKRADVAFLQYTGGTTGVSKGATLTHSNILSNIEQMSMWCDVGFRLKGRPDSIVYVCALPLYHIFALTVNAMIGIKQGGLNILIPNPRDIPAFVKVLQKHKFHFFPGLSTLFNGLMNNEEFRKLDFKELRMSFSGGMAMQKPVADRWKELTGSLMIEGYGLSETSPVASANPLDATEFSGTIGMPMPSTDFSIRDDDGKELPLLEVGEICIRGPQIMAGYWNRPDETAKVMTSDGFFRSGDMGYMDERGYTKIVDRKKDMILVSGFNVYPNEIEEVAMEHPGIAEAAAVAIANEHSGEAVKLFIVRKDKTLTEEAVKAFCAERLTNYKRPRVVEFRDELPKSNVGKILRRELRD